jgi:hypothetical protein
LSARPAGSSRPADRRRRARDAAQDRLNAAALGSDPDTYERLWPVIRIRIALAVAGCIDLVRIPVPEQRNQHKIDSAPTSALDVRRPDTA